MLIKLGAELVDGKIVNPKITILEFISRHNEKWSKRCQIVNHKVTPNCDSATFTWADGHTVTHKLHI